MKICTKCKDEKSLDQFTKNKRSKDGFHWWCKECTSEYLRNYRSTDQGKKVQRESSKIYRQTVKGQEKVKIVRDNRIKNGKESQYQLNRRKIDVGFRIRQNFSARISNLIIKKSKSQFTLNLLGCSIDFFKGYINNLFQLGMSWDNYGKNGWVIDHIIPCSYFDLTIKENQKICFNFRNLQPLWNEDNSKKSNKVPENVEELIENIKRYL